jgi:uncharacterized membrane protein
MTKMSASASLQDARTYFQATLRPNRSLSPQGFFWLMAVLWAISLTVGITFLLNGAWPVFGFFGLDVLLVYIAFKVNYRSGRLYETLRLTDADFEVKRVDPYGRTHEWHFQPYWLRVDMDDPPEHDSRLTVSSHGRSLVIGAFLTPNERLEVAEALRHALDEHRLAPAS